ncbi:MAG: AIR carboxylase family protein, partial [Peptococcaceae bacterium]|nr:AIR carboxylase family protein [Peptococcaceae bacterium]
AAITHIPVIGIPIKSKALKGVDSLYSIVQMPSGVPVATVGINAAKNAGILAAQIIALGDGQLSNKLIDYKRELSQGVEEKANRLKEIGYKDYLKP